MREDVKILFLHAYYDPEQMSSTHLVRDLEKGFAAEKFTIETVVPTPTRGVSQEIHKEYKNRKYEEKLDGAVRIHRFSMFREGRNPAIRALRYLLCNLIQYRKSVRMKDLDVILAMSTPPTQGMLCAQIKKRIQRKYKHSVPFVYILQDVFPDSLITTGMSSSKSLLYRIGKKIESYIYLHADQIIVISEDMKKNLLAKGVPEEKLHVIYNWIDTSVVQPIMEEDNPLFEEFDIPKNKFRVVYAGNMGMAQGLDTVISTARQLQERDDILFLLFGAGADEESLKEMAHDLKNVRFFPFLPVERSAEVYSLGDACIVSCRKGTGGVGVPSKTWTIMACGRPLILSFDRNSELSSLLIDAHAGLISEAGEANTLAANIETLEENEELCSHMGRNARNFAEHRVGRKQAVVEYVDILRETSRQNRENRMY